MNYKPNPIDLTGVELSEELQRDMELISKNIHETWGKERMQQGWKYGEVYSAKEQTHPCLIEYEALPETEKDIDRATVEQTIKMLLYMGYKIERAKET